MLADLVTWVCDSPRRLLVVGLALVIVVFVAGSALVGNGDGGGSGAGTGNSASISSTTAAVPDAGRYVSTAVDFVRLWAQLKPGETTDDWRARLTPLATPDYGDALRTTDPATLPGVQPEGEPVVRFLAQESAMIAVPLANGSSVLVTVVAGQGTSEPVVSDVQPNVGD